MVGFRPFSGQAGPQDPFRRVRLDKCCKAHLKSTQETNANAISVPKQRTFQSKGSPSIPQTICLFHIHTHNQTNEHANMQTRTQTNQLTNRQTNKQNTQQNKETNTGLDPVVWSCGPRGPDQTRNGPDQTFRPSWPLIDIVLQCGRQSRTTCFLFFHILPMLSQKICDRPPVDECLLLLEHGATSHRSERCNTRSADCRQMHLRLPLQRWHTSRGLQTGG